MLNDNYDRQRHELDDELEKIAAGDDQDEALTGLAELLEDYAARLVVIAWSLGTSRSEELYALADGLEAFAHVLRLQAMRRCADAEDE